MNLVDSTLQCQKFGQAVFINIASATEEVDCLILFNLNENLYVWLLALYGAVCIYIIALEYPEIASSWRAVFLFIDSKEVCQICNLF